MPPLIPGSHIRIYEVHTHTVGMNMNACLYLHSEKKQIHGRHRQMHRQTPQTYTYTPRPPSCQRVKPSACPTLPLRMFWSFCCYVVFPLMWVCVSLCRICSLLSWRDISWRRPSDWTFTNPLTTRLAVIGHDRTGGNGVSRWHEGWLNGWRDSAMGRWNMRDEGKVCSVWFKSWEARSLTTHSLD